MSKRPSASRAPKAPRKHSPGAIVSIWIGSLLSLGLLYLAGTAVDADLGSFRSCSANNNGLSVTNCGKSGLSPGDLVLLVLLALCACLVVTLFTAAWRMTRRTSK
jgi:hypothetical protein